MLSRVLSPRGLGLLALVLAFLAGVTAVVGVPAAAVVLRHGSTLGETGRTFFQGLFWLSVAVTLSAGLTGALLLDLRGVASILDRRAPQWRRTAAALGLLAAICALEWGIGFARQFLTVLGPGPTYYNRAEWLGVPLLVSNETYSLTDYFTSLLLLLSAAASGGAYMRGVDGIRMRLPRAAFAIFAVGFTYLALDEYLTIHEFIGANLPGLRDVTFVSHPDDLVMLCYFGVAGLVLAGYRHALLADRTGTALVAAAVVMQGIAAGGDAWFPASLWRLEEMLEVCAAGMYFLFVVRYSDPTPTAQTEQSAYRDGDTRSWA